MMFVVRDKIRRRLLDENDRTNSRGALGDGGGGSSCGTMATTDDIVEQDDRSSSTSSRIDSRGDDDEQLLSNSRFSGSGTPATTTVVAREPAYWQQHLDNIREMRSKRDAPVDTMGAVACADPAAPDPVRRYQILTALMLSSQTKDEVTSAAMARLRQYGCTPESIRKLAENKLSDMIYPVGFFSRKAEYVKRVADILAEKYAGDIPPNYGELCALPGVGPKMATLTMNLAWRQNVGVGVDTHVHRIANRLGWTLSATATPEQTENVLSKWLPANLRDDINLLFVGFGQQICTPLHPKCEDCLNQSICPFAMRN